MVHAAVALLPQFSARPLGELAKEDRQSILEQAVATARELMRLCNYGESGLTVEDFKSAVAKATQSDDHQLRPEWIRMPGNKGRCPYTGLGRSLLYTLVTPCAANGHMPPVRSVSVRRRGNMRGVRLIHLQSLLDYLDSQKL